MRLERARLDEDIRRDRERLQEEYMAIERARELELQRERDLELQREFEVLEAQLEAQRQLQIQRDIEVDCGEKKPKLFYYPLKV
jgi:hypothetical protein